MHDTSRPLSFWERARLDPDRAALIGPDDEVWPAQALLERCDAISARLQELGLRGGDAVAVAAASHPDALCVALAVTQIGGYYVPVSSSSTAPEVAYVLENCGADFLFAESAVLERVGTELSELPCRHVIRLGKGARGGSHTSVDEIVDAANPDWRMYRRCGQIMPYTSGTTGRPKGVRRPLPDADPDQYWGISSASSFETLHLGHRADDVHLVVSPMYHTAIINLASAALHVGQTVVVRERFEPLDTLDAVERYRVTNAHMVPTQFHRLLSVDETVRQGYDLTSIKALLHGAAPCPLAVKHRMIQWLGPVISEYYGASEGGGTFVSADEWLRRPGTVGRPYTGAEVHILDDLGAPVPPGVVGRVFLKPLGQLFEYHGDPDKTAESRSDGLITAGDLGYVDDAGYLFLRGRANDLVITGGVNVYPVEVEDALFAHPAIADATVIGLPDEEWGEIVTAVIELHSGWVADQSTQAAILSHCGERLARYKIPKRMEFVDDLPREPNGKIRKPQLVMHYQEVQPT